MRFQLFRQRSGVRDGHGTPAEQRTPRVLTVLDDGSIEAAARLAGFVVGAALDAVGAARLLRMQAADVLVLCVDGANQEQMAALVDCARRDHPAMRVWVQTNNAAFGAHLMLLGAERHCSSSESLGPLFDAAMQAFLERGVLERTRPAA
ncbi:MAG: hypothetical protein WCL53_06875 [Chloroflexota bacterium]